MENTLVLAFLFLFHFSPGGTYETYCSSGERLHTPKVGHDVCIPCPRGTFIAEEHHFFRECKPCTGIENPDVEVLVSACNSTHDAVILCTGGFYRRRARHVMEEDRCEKCTECPFPARPCEGYYDTVCCPPNHDAVMTPDGVFVCNEKPANLQVSIGDEITTKQPHGAIDAHKKTPQSNTNDRELPGSTERIDTDYVWILQLIFVTLLFCNILVLTVIVFPTKESDLMRDHTCANTYHYWCRIVRHVHKIRLFAIISPIVLCIFQSVVTILNTKPRFAYTLTAVSTLMILSILIVMASAITFIVCFHIIYKLRKNNQNFFMKMQPEICHLQTPEEPSPPADGVNESFALASVPPQHGIPSPLPTRRRILPHDQQAEGQAR